MAPFIINLAPTGMVPTSTMSSHVPLTTNSIVSDILSCSELGVSMAHIHARDENGEPTWRPDVYGDIIARIRESRPDLILTVSTSGRRFGDLAQRSAVLDLPGDLRPDMASLTLSSLNFSREASLNAPDMIVRLAEAMAEKGIRPELEVFDLGMVNVVHSLIKKGLLSPPYYINVILGNASTAQASLLHIAALVASLPQPAVVAFGGIGRSQTPVAGIAAAMADGVRTGLEDNIWLDRNRSTRATNGDLVKRVIRMAMDQERTIASPAQVRTILGLPRR
ncbi:MAG: 3-keto-5-aminohexanoate cleavage protein [Alphaproteobacteria bacterium]|nr:3-keto-5-aminohexanoate cleavage protein [Alphaproteobacteria bacterium]